VHVHLASGREIMLIGDIVWRLIGLALRHQKPDSVSKMLAGSAIHTLVRAGTLRDGFDLTSP
jgi:hypothetical protein